MGLKSHPATWLLSKTADGSVSAAAPVREALQSHDDVALVRDGLGQQRGRTFTSPKMSVITPPDSARARVPIAVRRWDAHLTSGPAGCRREAMAGHDSVAARSGCIAARDVTCVRRHTAVGRRRGISFHGTSGIANCSWNGDGRG